MKKIILSLFIVLCFCLTTLALMPTKEVHAQDNFSYQVEVVFFPSSYDSSTGQNSFGTTWVNNYYTGENADIRTGYFDIENGFQYINIASSNIGEEYFYYEYKEGYSPLNANNIAVYFDNNAFLFPDVEVSNMFDSSSWYPALKQYEQEKGSRVYNISFYIFSKLDVYDITYVYKTSADDTTSVTYQMNINQNLLSVLPDGAVVPGQVQIEGLTLVRWIGDDGNYYTNDEVILGHFNKSIVLTADYSTVVYKVHFWYNFTEVDVREYPAGVGTITPIPEFNFGVGVRLLGWSFDLNGSVIDLSTYELNQDITIYAVTIFDRDNSNSSVKIDYLSCEWYDIPCHIGNSIVYILNEFPLISDVVELLVPIVDLVQFTVDNLMLFETLGWLFTISISILLMFFIIRLFR